MPRIPAASITEKARYGLQAGSGARYSIRVDDALFLAIGTRTSAERMFRAQLTYTGASKPGISRLYEFTVWLVMAAMSLACASSPAMKPLPVADRLYGSPAS